MIASNDISTQLSVHLAMKAGLFAKFSKQQQVLCLSTAGMA